MAAGEDYGKTYFCSFFFLILCNSLRRWTLIVKSNDSEAHICWRTIAQWRQIPTDLIGYRIGNCSSSIIGPINLNVKVRRLSWCIHRGWCRGDLWRNSSHFHPLLDATGWVEAAEVQPAVQLAFNELAIAAHAVYRYFRKGIYPEGRKIR